MIDLPASRPALRKSLLGGAAYDVALGAFILFWGESTMAAVGHPITGFKFYYFLGGLPLVLLPVFYFAAARAKSIDDFRAPVLWVRGGGGVLLILLTMTTFPGPDWIFYIIGAADLVWAGIHFALWRSSSQGPEIS